MSLSWGRTPLPEQPAGPLPRLARVAIGAVFLTATALMLGDDAHRFAPLERERAAIVALLEARRSALASHDRVRFLSLIDPGRVGYRDCQREAFDRAARLDLRSPPLYLGKVQRVGDYIRAWVDDGPGFRRMYFRRVDGIWLFSEPLASELGDERDRIFSDIRVHYWAVDDDLTGFLGQELVTLREIVVTNAPQRPTTLFSLKIDPVTDPRGGRWCFVAGQASQSAYSPATSIVLREIWLNTGYNALAYETRQTLEHEALHWIQFDHASGSIAGADWWLVEGWPTLIANPTPAEFIRRDLCVRVPPSYAAMRAGPVGTTPEETERFYRIASTIVDHLTRTRGRAAYWVLFDAYKLTGDPNEAFRSIGIDPQSFYAEWLEATRFRYCG